MYHIVLIEDEEKIGKMIPKRGHTTGVGDMVGVSNIVRGLLASMNIVRPLEELVNAWCAAKMI